VILNSYYIKEAVEGENVGKPQNENESGERFFPPK